jgi:Flp pilus assembly protein TadG
MTLEWVGLHCRRKFGADRHPPSRSKGERGAALIEAAIMIPVVMLVTFGMIEFSSAYQSSSAATAAARSGARVASAEALLPNYALDAAAAAATALHVIGGNEPLEMWVYKADANGYPDSGNFTSCTTHCIKYTWLTSTHLFDTANPSGGGWPANTQNACNSATWDSVGVYVKINHRFLTRLFGASITLGDHAVFRLEPAPTQLCP